MKTRTNLALGGTVIATLSLLGGTAYGQCDSTAPGGAIAQNDPAICDGTDPTADANGGCLTDSQQVQDLGVLGAGTHVISGTLGFDGATIDSDWYTFAVAQVHFVTVSVRTTDPLTGLESGSPIFVYTTGSGCSDYGDLLGYAGVPCDFLIVDNAVQTSGNFMLLTQPYFTPEVTCPDRIEYLITMDITFGNFPECGDPAGGSCTEANDSQPGCSDFGCCELVCEIDSVCCSSGWDSACVDLAYENCGYFLYECNETSASPPNDCAANAEVAATFGVEYAFDTTNAETDGPPQPECGSAPEFAQLDKDIWFLVTAPEDGFMQAITCGYMTGTPPDWDTKVAAYGPYADFPNDFDGDLLEAAFVLCNEDGCDDGTYTSSLSFEATGGSQYLIRIGGWNGENGSGNVFIDFLGGACEPGSAVVVGDNEVGNTEAILPFLDLDGFCDTLNDGTTGISNPEFYSFTATEDGEHTFTTCNQAGFDTSLALLDGLTCDNSAALACNGDASGCAGYSSEFTYGGIVAGNDYTVVVGGWSAGDIGTATLTIVAGAPPDPCKGYTNSCASPEVITDVGTYEIETAPCNEAVDYTGLCDPGTFGDDTIKNPYFIQFTPPTTDVYTFSTCNDGTPIDTRLGIQSDCDPSSVLTCLDDTEGCPNYTTTISWNLTEGVDVIVVVGGYSDGDFGDVRLEITGGEPPDPCEDYTNTCTDAEVITGYGDFEFETVCAGILGDRNWDATGFCDFGDFGDEICYNTYFFEYVVTDSNAGLHDFSVCNQASYDTRIFISNSCDPSGTLFCNDDATDCALTSALLQVDLTNGVYIVGVGGYSATSSGTGTLTVLGPDEPDCPADLNGDGEVNGADLTILLGDWGGGAADLNGDGIVNGADLTILLGSWGPCA